MAKDRTDSGTPRSELPAITGQVRPARPGESNLATRLVPTVDKIRQLYTRFGMRSYRVWLVHVLWSGQRIGDGTAIEVSRQEILPTPNVIDMQGTSEVMHAIGLSEEGGISIDQISAKYTEDDLMGMTPDLVDPALARTGVRNAEFFYEVIEARPSNPQPIPRRYVPDGVPMLSRDEFQWKISLKKQDFNRSRQRTFNRTQA